MVSSEGFPSLLAGKECGGNNRHMIVTKHNIVRLKRLRGVQTDKHRIEHWNIDIIPTLVDLEHYRCFWFESIEITRTKKSGIITFVSKVTKTSCKYFINAYVEQYEDVLVNNKDLAGQMEDFGWTHIARNIGVESCWTEPFDPDVDKLINLNGDLINDA